MLRFRRENGNRNWEKSVKPIHLFLLLNACAHKNLTLKEANNLISKYPAAGKVPSTLLQNNRADLILGMKPVTLQILLGTTRSCSMLRTRCFTPLFGRDASGHVWPNKLRLLVDSSAYKKKKKVMSGSVAGISWGLLPLHRAADSSSVRSPRMLWKGWGRRGLIMGTLPSWPDELVSSLPF